MIQKQACTTRWCYGLTICLLTALSTTYLVFLRNSFSLLTYPFYFPDSYDWLVNGLRYSHQFGTPFAITHRAMLLPLVVAFLFDTGLEDYAVLYGTIFYGATSLLIYFATVAITDRTTALLTAALYLTSYTILSQSAFLGSDISATFFLILSAHAYYRYLTTGRPHWIAILATALGIGIHTQYIQVIVAPAMLPLLFLKETRAGISFTAQRVTTLFTTPLFYLSLLIGAGVTLAVFAPRLATFHLLYEEGVQHTSLVTPHVASPLYYIAGFLSSFSWVSCAVALYGLWRSWRDGNKYLTLFFLFWITWVLLFFTFLYTWKDIRFLLYVSYPFFYFAAYGIKTIFSRLGKIVGVVVAVATFYQVHSPPTLDPFDLTFSLDPWHAVEVDHDYAFRIKTEIARPYYLLHFREVRRAFRKLWNKAVDTAQVSEPLIILFESLKDQISVTDARVVFFDTLAPHEPYFVRNRNMLYARSRVDLIGSIAELRSLLETTDVLLVTRATHLDQFLSLYTLSKGKPHLLGEQGEYRAVLFQHDPRITFRAVDYIRSITAETPEKLFNGLADRGDDYASARLGTPIRIDFVKPEPLSRITLHLWSFDERRYTFKFYAYLPTGEKRLVSDYSQTPERGSITIPLTKEPLSAVEIVGLTNSDTEKNPGNSYFHLTEIEFAR